jgi:hypothetical protein
MGYELNGQGGEIEGHLLMNGEFKFKHVSGPLGNFAFPQRGG